MTDASSFGIESSESYAAPTTPDEILAVCARIYKAPREECNVLRVEIEQHRDTCERPSMCGGCRDDIRYEIVTVEYPGRARGVTDGPLTVRWHSTWGRVVGTPSFELYAD